MHIQKKVAGGHLLRCGHGHSFVVKRLGLSVECPNCGETALSTELATAFRLALAARAASEAAPANDAVAAGEAAGA